MFQMIENLYRTPGISKHRASELSKELQSLGAAFNEQLHHFQEENRKLVSQKHDLNLTITSGQRLIQNALSERDRACGERDQAVHENSKIRLELDHLQYRQRQTERRFAEIETKHEAAIRELNDQIKLKEEQLAGKRTLWLENHPSSALRRSGGPASTNPYETPTPNRGSRVVSPPGSQLKPMNLMQQFTSMQLPEVSPAGPSARSTEYISTLPFGSAKPNPGLHSLSNINDSGAGSRAECGSDPPRIVTSTAVVPFKSLAEIAEGFSKVFDTMFEKLEVYAFKYSNTLPELEYDQNLSHDEVYWASLMKCAFPKGTNYTNTDSHTYTIMLLRDAQTRAWFTMRIFVQYLFDEVFTPKNWLNFNDTFDEELNIIEARLAERGKSFSWFEMHRYLTVNPRNIRR
jgi:hypothetical protein